MASGKHERPMDEGRKNGDEWKAMSNERRTMLNDKCLMLNIGHKHERGEGRQLRWDEGRRKTVTSGK